MSSKPQKSPSRPTAASKHDAYLQRRYGKQQHRRTRSGVLPSPTLNIPLDSYTSFVTHLQSSTRILALLGAGLSAASGIPIFRGPGGFWREHNAMDLATPEAFFKDPGLVWQYYNYRSAFHRRSVNHISVISFLRNTLHLSPAHELASF